jgi:hypothetical protein
MRSLARGPSAQHFPSYLQQSLVHATSLQIHCRSNVVYSLAFAGRFLSRLYHVRGVLYHVSESLVPVSESEQLLLIQPFIAPSRFLIRTVEVRRINITTVWMGERDSISLLIVAPVHEDQRRSHDESECCESKIDGVTFNETRSFGRGINVAISGSVNELR